MSETDVVDSLRRGYYEALGNLQDVTKERDALLRVCQECFELLEKHEPQWYTRGLYNRLTAVLGQAN